MCKVAAPIVRRLHFWPHSCMLCAMAQGTPLGKKFFKRDTLTVAHELLGKSLVHGETSLMITEVKHRTGPMTSRHTLRVDVARNSVMFGEAGVWYIYLCYGHWGSRIS